MAVKHRQRKTKRVRNEFRQASSVKIYGTVDISLSDYALLPEFSFVLPDTIINFLVLRGQCLHTQADTAACLTAVYIYIYIYIADGCAVTCCYGHVLGNGFSCLDF
jgi:hypothetical protein